MYRIWAGMEWSLEALNISEKNEFAKYCLLFG